MWYKSPSANRLGDQAMIAIRPVRETWPAHKSVPDIETNVRPILSDIAALAWLMVRDIQYLQKFTAAAATVNPAVLAARRQHSLPFSTIWRDLFAIPLLSPSSIEGLYRFLLFRTLAGMYDSDSRIGKNLFWKIQCHLRSRSCRDWEKSKLRWTSFYYPGNDWLYLFFRIVPCYFIDIVCVRS